MKPFLIKVIGYYVNLLSYFSQKAAAKKALSLFVKPRKGRLNHVDIATLSQTFQESINYEGYEIMTYRWPGKGATILLVHGWESNAARWQFLIPTLKSLDFNIVALDGPGHGDSSGNYFNALLYSEIINKVVLKFNPSIIIGHSVGGLASVFSQSKYQNKSLKKLVMLGAPSEFKDVLKRYTMLIGYNSRVENALYKLIEEEFDNPPSYYSGANFSKNISTKSLLIHDLDDLVIPHNDALLYKENLKNASLISTKGLGHGLKQQEVIEHVVEFINN